MPDYGREGRGRVTKFFWKSKEQTGDSTIFFVLQGFHVIFFDTSRYRAQCNTAYQPSFIHTAIPSILPSKSMLDGLVV